MEVKAIIVLVILLESVTILLFMSRGKWQEKSPSIPFIYDEECACRKDLSSCEKWYGILNHEEWHVDLSKPKKTIKLRVVDSWEPDPTNEKPNCYICNFLSRVYKLDFSGEPDFVFYSVFGKKHLNYKNCVKILFSGENYIPNFNKCDYAITLNDIDV